MFFDPQRTFIIAEISANHNGSLNRAVETIHAAAKCGVDAIKLQTYTADTLTIDCQREEFVVQGGLWQGRTLYELYQEAYTPWEWHPRLFEEARRYGLDIFSTPFDASAVYFLESLKVTMYKIASFEIVDLELIEKVAKTRKPIIMSTGMASLAEIDEAVRRIRSVWGEIDHSLCLLHCISEYPASPEAMNLRTIQHLGEAFGVTAGLSDHSLGSHIAIAATALGARVIEKHFTLSRKDKGPDSAFSMEPKEMTQMVQAIRETEKALGQVSYGPGTSQSGSLTFRRSIFVVKDIAAGETISRENVRVIRPGHGLAPRFLPLVLGRRTKRPIESGSPLELSMLR